MSRNRRLVGAAAAAFAAISIGCASEEDDVRSLREERRDDFGARPRAPRDMDGERQAARRPRAGGGDQLTLPAQGDLLRITRTAPDEVRLGEEFEYRIEVTNVSDQPLHGVSVREEFDGVSLRVLEASATGRQRSPQGGSVAARAPRPGPGGAPRAGQQRQQEQAQRHQQQQRPRTPEATGGVWPIGTLMPGETRAVEVSAVAVAEGPVRSCVTATFQPAMCSTLNVTAPELVLLRVLVDAEGRPVDRLYACDDAFLVYRVENVGTGTTEPIVIRDRLPANVRAGDRQAIELRIDPLGAGEKADRRVPLELRGPADFKGTALAQAGEIRARSNELTGIRIMQPELGLMVQGPDRALVDDRLEYTVRVSNVGRDPAVETTVRLEGLDESKVSLSLPEGVRREGNEILIGELAPGEQLAIEVAARTPQEPGRLQLQAVVEGYCVDAIRRSVSTQVLGVPAIRLEVIDESDPIEVGEVATYEVRVKNQGSASDLNIEITAELPRGMQFVSAEGDTDVRAARNLIQLGAIDELPPGETASWSIRARATEPGQLRFRLGLNSRATGRAIVEEEPTTVIESRR